MLTKEEARNRLAINVRRVRQRLGLTQMDLARVSGVPQAAISRLERAEGLLNSADLHNIAEALETSMDALHREAPERVPAEF